MVRTTLSLSRLIPGITVFGAGLAILLSLLGIMKFSLSEGIIVALLGLLAADALTERMGILDRLERTLSTIRVGKTLRSRHEILPIPQHAAGATEICIAAISAISVAHSNLHFFTTRLKEGCKLRLVLLNPKSPHLEAFDLQSGTATAESSIRAALGVLESLLYEPSPGSCEIRLSEVFLPFSMVAVNPNTHHGSMVVEFYAYRKKVDERPHLHLTAGESPHWFGYYRTQFESIWSDSILWPGNRVEGDTTLKTAGHAEG